MSEFTGFDYVLAGITLVCILIRLREGWRARK
jgi:hypothetical protein